MNTFLTQLNNTINTWKNLYGDFYNMCYDENGNIREMSDIEERQLFQSLNECKIVYKVLEKLKRNRFVSPKKRVKLKYKLGD